MLAISLRGRLLVMIVKKISTWIAVGQVASSSQGEVFVDDVYNGALWTVRVIPLSGPTRNTVP